MKVMLNMDQTNLFQEIYIEEDYNIETVKYLVEAELGLPFEKILIYHNTVLLNNNSLLVSQTKIKEDDILVIKEHRLIIDPNQSLFNKPLVNSTSNNISNTKKTNNNMSKIFDDTMSLIKSNPNPIISSNSLQNRAKNEAMRLKEYYLSDSVELNLLLDSDPTLAEYIISGDDENLIKTITERLAKYEEKKKTEEAEYLKLANSDSNDAEAQKKIEEFIRKKNIDENLKMAQEYMPETFHSIHMLFIPLEINKYRVISLVDTGAQTTIMSVDIAHKSGLYNLIDTRYSGIAKGVGTSKILGVIHAAQIKINDK